MIDETIVFANGKQGLALAVANDGEHVDFISLGNDILKVVTVPCEQFAAEWVPEHDKTLARVLGMFFDHAANIGALYDAREALDRVAEKSGIQPLSDAAETEEISEEDVVTISPDGDGSSLPPADLEPVGTPQETAAVPAPRTAAEPPVVEVQQAIKPVTQEQAKMSTHEGQNQPGNLSMAVCDGKLVIDLGTSPPERKMAPEDFTERPLAASPQSDVRYYVAINGSGAMQRCVSTDVVDRQVVAALVGNWVAEGLLVDLCDRRGLMKHLRLAEAVAKQDAEKAQGENSGSEPSTAPQAESSEFPKSGNSPLSCV